MLPALTQSKQDKFDYISGTLKQGQFYAVKDIIHSKAFLRSFDLDSGDMASSGGDNTEEKNAGDSAHVATDEGESHHSRGDHSEMT